MSSKGTAFEIRKLHFLRAGHGFGRRLDVDGVVRAVQIAQHVEGPVKVVWTHFGATSLAEPWAGSSSVVR